MEMNPDKPANSRKPWLIGLGIGCGAIVVIVILLFVGGYYFVRNITSGFKDSEEVSAALKAKYGRAEDFVPDPSGAVPPDRIEAFLKVRENSAPARKALEGTLGELARREKSLSAIRYGIGMVPQMAEYLRARGQALLDSGMGPGEYQYIYAIAYFSWLKKPPEDGAAANVSMGGMRVEGGGAEAAEVRRDIAARSVNRTILPLLRNQLGKASGAFRDALIAETEALLAESRRLPWPNGLPDVLRASLEPFRDRLEANYSPQANLFELFFEIRER